MANNDTARMGPEGLSHAATRRLFGSEGFRMPVGEQDVSYIDPQVVLAARRQFFSGKTLPVDTVPHAILRSWIRCAEMGLDERAIPATDAATASEMRQLQERYETLRQISRPELDALYVEARELSGIVILTNAKGEVLDAVGDAHFATRAERVALRPGAHWSEENSGTNAIGTALAERRAVTVNGPEHYFQPHAVLSCQASPILDPRGAIIGVLDLSLPATPQPAHLLGLVRMAVEQIEHRMFRSGFDGCQTLRFQADRNLLGAAREGILVVRDGVIVGANRRGLSLIGRSYDGIDDMRVDDIFDGPLPSPADHGHDSHARIVTPDGREFFARLEAENHFAGRSVRAEDFAGESETAPAVVASAAQSPKSLEEVELALMRSTLEAQGGNVSAAARILGVHRSTLYRRLGITH